jgi:dimeric dUTPase (all-alpha-NTP-PPase superfamily)
MWGLNMNIENLLMMQQELDMVIAKNLNMEEDFNSVETVDQRVFALKVELGEFANETGWFKYWKRSHVMDRDKTLEEHADVMHFLLSVGNSRKYNFIKEINPGPWSKVPLNRLFCYMMENAYDSSGKWKNAFEHLICIGLKLGFTEKEMLQAYKDKNAENHARQKRGY